jgi:hypothetical protein
MQCKTDELSKKAASSFIQHLQTAAGAGQQTQEVPAQTPLRRVG